jgi:hypothetical protein
LPAVLPGAGFTVVTVRLFMTIAAALAVLAAAAHLLRIREYELARDMILTRLRRARR